jgi:thioredoxin
MKKITLLFAILTMAIPTFASEPIAMDRQMFIERVFDFQNDNWEYRGDKPAIINFWASWCAPCRLLSRTLTQIAREFGDDIYVYKINVDEQPELAAAFGVRTLPFTLFVPMEGAPQARTGNLSRRTLRRVVNEILLNE